MNSAIAHPTHGLSARTSFFGAFARACRPRQRLTVSQWADAHRVLTTKASGEPGPWKTARVPFMREIMDCLSVSSPVRSVTLMKASQIAGTEAALNWIGYVMDHAPASMLVVQPTLDVRERFVKQRLDPMLRGTPALADLFDVRRRRDATNTEAIKDFPAGMLILGGANSSASLASMPIKYVVNDELDRFPWEVGDEGDPHGLIRARQRNFRRRKELNISTPTVKGASRIDELREAGDQRQYHVPCPHCGELQVLEWKNLRWTLDPATREPLHVAYVCRHCGAEIEEHHKTEMLEEAGHGGRARWIPQHPERSERDRSYQNLSALYSPLGLGLRWIEIVREWLAAQGDRTKLKVFINTILGEPWEDRTHTLDHKTLAERAEPYNLREIPLGCLLLTCGVDVQGDRLELQLLGHGRGKITWTLDYLVIPGDPARDEVWDQLTAYLVRPLVNGFGRELRIEATAIDSGYLKDQVGAYARRAKDLPQAQRPRRLMVVKGANVPGKPVLGRPTPQDVTVRGRTIKHGMMQWEVGGDSIKELLTARLKSDANHDAGSRLVRFSQALPEDFYRQLTAEVFDPERNRWVKLRNRRNEALDTFCYGLAAAYHPEIRVHAMTARDWARLEQMLEPPRAPGDAPVSDAPKIDTPVSTPAPKPKPPADDGGFGKEGWNL